MILTLLDWGIIISFLVITLLIGFYASRSSQSGVRSYFLSGNDMPWWLLGISMVATTFSADTPNLVTDIIRKNGVSGNWVWWAFLLTGMLTVFVYAKLWRRSGIVTDLEFYEMRYSGWGARFLRQFRAVYLGVFFNVFIMGTVLLAGIKISSIMLGISAEWTVLIVGVVTVIYASVGGLKGVILTDFFQFVFSMLGMVIAAIYIVQMPEIGSVSALIEHPAVANKIDVFPDFNDWDTVVPLLIIPLAIQWWSIWYPGAEPGGGGYIAQRMLSARNEEGAVKATLLFNIAHYALRPWPWILIALASIVVFPDYASIQSAFPHIDPNVIGDDIAFPAMLTLLPKGLVGLLVAALVSALMSTLSTHLNWGSSYIVNDIVMPWDKKQQLSERQLLWIGQITTVVLMILSAWVALYVFDHAKEAFDLLILMGAGTGLVFILRWFWWRVNAYAEIVAMIVSFLVAVYFKKYFTGDWHEWQILLANIGITTVAWVSTCYITPRTHIDTLRSFYKTIRPYGGGWKQILPDVAGSEETKGSLGGDVLRMILGSILIYNTLFMVGAVLYGQWNLALINAALIMCSGYFLFKHWKN